MNIPRLTLLVLGTLVASSAANSETQKWCQSASLSPNSPPSNWFSAQDIPTHWAIYNNRKFEATGRYMLSVKSDGRVSDCKVVQTATSDLLDTVACKNFERRPRFNKLDETGCGDLMRYVRYEIYFSWDFDHDIGDPVTRVAPS